MLRIRLGDELMEWWENYFSEVYYLTAATMNHSAKHEVDFILNQVDIPQGVKILDMCCGYGRHSYELAQRGYDVTGVDYSEELINKAMKKIANEDLPNLRYKTGDIRYFQDDRQYNMVLNLFISLGFFKQERDNEKAIEMLCNLVAENGYLILELHNYVNIIKQKDEEMKVPGGYIIKTFRYFDSSSKRLSMERVVTRKEYSKVYEINVRVYEFTEILDICSKYGMKHSKHFGDYSGSIFDNNSERLLLFLRKNL
jgi:SAM-dependent methyltransferase